MIRCLSCTILCLMLTLGGIACAPMHTESPSMSPAGYTFSLHTAPHPIWLTPPEITTPGVYLGFGELVVEVRNAQGQPIDNIPVEFQVEPSWSQDASVTPQQATTQSGMARTLLMPRTTGVVRVLVRVDNVMQKAAFLVQSPHVGNSTSWPDLRGLPYPPHSPPPLAGSERAR